MNNSKHCDICNRIEGDFLASEDGLITLSKKKLNGFTFVICQSCYKKAKNDSEQNTKVLSRWRKAVLKLVGRIK